MGRAHMRAIHQAEGLELVAVCDLDEARARETSEPYPGVAIYTDFTRMLAEVRPEVVALAVPNAAHAPLTIQAAEAGVRGICCEKPVATSLAEARAMADASARHGAQLIINHQRRMLPSLIRMRELILEGAIGDVYLLRGSCSGDLLTDGTHLIDSLLHLAGGTPPFGAKSAPNGGTPYPTGDAAARWVFGAVYRLPPPEEEERGGGYYASGGWRYGHPVETGAMATWEFAGGLRAEILCGQLRFPERPYNDYEVLGSRGRLWRVGDREEPGVLIQTCGTDGWQPIGPVNAHEERSAMTSSYSLLARNLRAGGGDHPLSVERALRGLEILMAIFESARLRTRIELPLQQDRFPLEIMIEEGQL
jgi:UDP-N-acetyl-2-amino-2-deoxyglucuronate dehydrogenase